MTVNYVVTIGMFLHIREMLGRGLLQPEWTEMWTYLVKCAAEQEIVNLELRRIEAATEIAGQDTSAPDSPG